MKSPIYLFSSQRVKTLGNIDKCLISPLLYSRRITTCIIAWMVLFICSIFFAPLSNGQNKRIYNVAISEEDTPYEFEDKSGSPSGYSVAVLKEIEKISSISFNFTTVSPSDALEGLTKGKFDLVNMIKTNERSRYYLFSDPHSSIEHAIFRNSSSHEILTLESLSRRKVALQMNDICQETLATRNDFVKIFVQSKEEGFLLLNSDKVDAFVSATQQGLRIIREYDLSNLEVASTGLFKQDYCFASRKGNGQLIIELNVCLKQLHNSGRLEALAKEWFLPIPPAHSYFERYSERILAILVILAISIIGSIVWVIALRRKVNFRTRLLQDRERRLKLLSDASFESLFVSENGICIELNLAAEKLFGYSKSEVVGKNVLDLISPEFRSEMHQRATLGDDGPYEIMAVKKDGMPFPCQIQGRSQYYQGREVRISAISDISLQKQAEEELRQSEQKYRSIFENVQDVFYRIDSNGIITDVSPSVERYSGYTPEEVLGHSILEFYVDPEFRKNVLELLLKKGELVDYENILRNKDGSAIYISVNAHLIYDSDGKPIGLEGSVRNINERKQIEEALRESELNLRTLIESLPDKVFFKDGEGRWIKVNQSALELFRLTGYSYEGKKDMELADIVPELKEVFEYCTFTDKRAWDTGEAVRGEEKMVDQNGHLLIFDTIKVPLFHPDHSRKGLVIIGRDITERYNAERELRKYSMALTQSPVSIMITDKEGIIEYANPYFYEVSGYSPDEVIGKKPNILTSGEMSLDEYRLLWDALLEHGKWKGEFHNKKKNGELYWESASISALTNNEGEITNYLAIKEDITNKKHIIRELLAAKEKAEEMNRLKSSFLANMNHELRTPLNGIIGFSEILLEDETDKEKHGRLERILKSAARLNETLNSILDLSQIDSGTINFTLNRHDIFALTKRITTRFIPELTRKNLKLHFPEKKQSFYASIDERLFIQIINNLLHNAVKFTKHGSVAIEIDYNFVNSKKWVILKVKDTGIGIPYKHREIIFDEFRQVSEGHGRYYEGSGIGLTLVKKLTEAMGGTISVDSQEGNGAVFTVGFPACLEDGEMIDIVASSYDQTTYIKDNYFTHSKLPLILYVEDERTNQEVVQIFLAEICKVDVVSDAESAITMVTTRHYDYFLIDINLGPGMNGIELAKELRKMDEYKDTPLVAVTAYAGLSDRDEFLQNGFTHYISKPFYKTEFTDHIKEILSKTK